MNVLICNPRATDFEENLMKSITSTGFVVLSKSHGIDLGLIREAQSIWREFFLSDKQTKEFYINEQDPNLGYKGFKSETAVGAKHVDLKQFYHYRPNEAIPDEAKEVTNKLFYSLEDLGLQILSIIGKKMPGNFNYRDSCKDSNNTILRAIHYPALDFDVKPGQVRAAEHFDINMLTLLVAASAPGLEVKDYMNKWHKVPHEENTITVNLSDMLQLASEGELKSTMHRVVNPDDSLSDRLSIPLFLHPHSDTVLYDGITAQQFLNQRLDQIYNRK